MGVVNLSIVFAPCFLRPEVMGLDDMARTKIVNAHFSYLIENQLNYCMINVKLRIVSWESNRVFCLDLVTTVKE
jgi:hypothetical protein